jgi:surface antigen
MKKGFLSLAGFTFLITVAGCANMSNQDAGVLTGGAIGGAVGSLFGKGSGRIFATVGGTVLGAYLGGRVGNNMDKVDRMKMNQALERTPTGQQTHWKNPDTGDSYVVKPTRTYHEKKSDQPCRDFTTKALIGDKQETVYGRACRKADGTWKLVQRDQD